MSYQPKNMKLCKLDELRQFTLFTLAFVTIFMLNMTSVYAVGNVGPALCTMINNEMFAGQLGKAIATIGVLIVGVGAALGKVSWTMAVTVAVGISCMFAARAIAGSLGGGCP